MCARYSDRKDTAEGRRRHCRRHPSSPPFRFRACPRPCWPKCRAPGIRRARRSRYRMRISSIFLLCLLDKPPDLRRAGRLVMYVGDRRLPAAQRLGRDRNQFRQSLYIRESCRFDREPALIDPSALLDGLGKTVMMPRRAVILDTHLERLIAHRHDPFGRHDAAWAMLARFEAVDAVPEPARTLGQLEALARNRVARVVDETIGLHQRGGSDEVEVNGQHGAALVAESAVIATHRFADIGHRGLGQQTFAVGARFHGFEPGFDAIDLVPHEALPVRDEIFEDPHMADRLDRDFGTLLRKGRDFRGAGRACFAVCPYHAFAAIAAHARGAEGKSGVLLVANLEQTVHHGRVAVKLDRVIRVGRFGVLAGLLAIYFECNLHWLFLLGCHSGLKRLGSDLQRTLRETDYRVTFAVGIVVRGEIRTVMRTAG